MYTSEEEEDHDSDIEDTPIGGVGLVLEAADFASHICPCIVDDLVDGSPAALSGAIRIGDFLLEVDSISVAGWTVQQIAEKIVGNAGSSVNLKLESIQGNYEVALIRSGSDTSRREEATHEETLEETQSPKVRTPSGIQRQGSMKWSMQNKEIVVTTLRKDLVETRKRSKINMLETQERVSVLERDVASKNAEIREMMLKLEDTELRFETMKAEVASCEALISHWEDEVVQKKEELEKERNDLTTRLEIAERDAAARDKTRAETVSQLRKELFDLKKEHSRVTDQVGSKVKRAESEIQGRVAELNKNLAMAEAKSEALQSQYNQSTAQLKDIESRNTELEKQLSLYEGQVNNDEHIQVLQDGVAKGYTEIQHLKAKELVIGRYTLENKELEVEKMKSEQNRQRALFDTWREEIEQQKKVLLERAQKAEMLVAKVPHGQEHEQFVAGRERQQFDTKDELSALKMIDGSTSESLDRGSSSGDTDKGCCRSNGTLGSPSRSQEADFEVVKMRESLQAMHEPQQRNKEELEAAWRSTAVVKAELETAKSQHHQAQQEVISLKSQMSELTNDNNNVRAEVQKLRSRLQSVTKHFEETQLEQMMPNSQKSQSSDLLASDWTNGTSGQFVTLGQTSNSLPDQKSACFSSMGKSDLFSDELLNWNTPITLATSSGIAVKVAPPSANDHFGFSPISSLQTPTNAEISRLTTELDLSRVESQRAQEELHKFRNSAKETQTKIATLEKQLERSVNSEKELQKLREEAKRSKEQIEVLKTESSALRESEKEATKELHAILWSLGVEGVRDY